MNKDFLTPQFCRQFAQARREKGLTQSAAAREVGCTQSAISMLEGGQADKIAGETVEKLAALLGIELPQTQLPVQQTFLSAEGFCPDCNCPSNTPFAVGDRLLFYPQLQKGRHCRFCGELLETVCPNCGASLQEGASCTACGSPYVTSVLPQGVDKLVWTQKRIAELAALKNLLQSGGR